MGLNAEIDLTARQRRLVLELIDRHLPDTDVWAYGSRVDWTSRPQSDLDLVVFSESERNGNVSDLREAFEESHLPFRVDVLVWHDLPDSFQKAILQRHCALIESRPRSPQCQSRIRLGDCARLVRDVVNPQEMPSDTPYIGLGHIPPNHLSVVTNSTAASVTSVKNRFRRGDILFGKLRPYFRKVARPQYDGICSTDFWVLRARDGVDQEFLFYHLASQDFADHVTAGSEGTRMPRAKWSHAATHILTIPTFSEQQDIARFLSLLDQKIHLARQMSATLYRIIDSVFCSWFLEYNPVRTKANDHSSDLSLDIFDGFPDQLLESSLGEIPAGWRVKTIGEVLDLAYGRSLKHGDRQHDGDIPVYGANGQIGWHDNSLVSGPGIVVGRKGNPGSVTWVATNFFAIDTTFYVIPRISSEALPFLFGMLRHYGLPSLAGDTAVPGLNRKTVYMSQIVMPTDDVIASYSRYINPLLALVSSLTMESKVVERLRDLILPLLLSGKLLPASRLARFPNDTAPMDGVCRHECD